MIRSTVALTCFEYPQYFSRLFKSKVGVSPGQFGR